MRIHFLATNDGFVLVYVCNLSIPEKHTSQSDNLRYTRRIFVFLLASFSFSFLQLLSLMKVHLVGLY